MTEVCSISPDDLYLWCDTQNWDRSARRELKRHVQQLWEEESSRPEWTLGFYEGNLQLGRLLLLRETMLSEVLVLDCVELPWQGSWKSIARALLKEAAEVARNAGAAALGWDWELRPLVDPGPLLKELGFIETGERHEWQATDLVAGARDPGAKSGVSVDSESLELLKGLDPLVLDEFREAGDQLLWHREQESLLLAFCDGLDQAEVKHQGTVPTKEATQGFAALLRRQGVRRITMESASDVLPVWFGALSRKAPIKQHQLRQFMRPL